MTNTELFAAVRILEESGDLRKMASDILFRAGTAEILAQFSLAVLEQPEVAWRHLDGPLEFAKPLTQSKSVADSWKAKGWKVAPMFMLPPVSAPDDFEQRAERAAKAVVQWLYEGMDGATVKLMSINVEAIITSVLKGEE